MILKRTEKEQIIEVLYDSSNILASSYDQSNNDLIITFKRGARYVYNGVTPKDYLKFEIAESQGKEFNKVIKPKYGFKKLDDIDAKEIITEIKTLKE
jgi:hypothetical protein